jgi:hypothetical protein
MHLQTWRTTVLCLEDCLEFSDLSADELAAIAAHEHVPLIVAAEIGFKLLKTPEGIRCLDTLFLETAAKAHLRGSLDEADRFQSVYQKFHVSHPDCSTTPSSSPSSF